MLVSLVVHAKLLEPKWVANNGMIIETGYIPGILMMANLNKLSDTYKSE